MAAIKETARDASYVLEILIVYIKIKKITEVQISGKYF